ncbi:MAG: hypothetical protein ACYSWQ_23405 [Planctomycetota bacterium]|jgi:hypothetical protein
MKDDPDMGTQSGVAIRQRTEVERLIAHDPGIERRLQKLRKCRTLLGSLPCVDAPPQILEAIKTSLASTAVLYEQSSYGKRMGRIHLLTRKVLSAAAMLALVGLLAAVIYTIMAPHTTPDGPTVPPLVKRPTASSPALAFNGRLELTTSMLGEVGAIVNTAIVENGLSDSVGDVREPTRRIHYVKCSKEGLDSLLASLEYAWPKLDSATMVINTELFNDQVSVDTVTTRQIAKIIDQESHEERIELAKDFDMLNRVTANMPGGRILVAIEGETPGLMIPRPIIVGPPDAKRTPAVPEADKTIRLTIILSR